MTAVRAVGHGGALTGSGRQGVKRSPSGLPTFACGPRAGCRGSPPNGAGRGSGLIVADRGCPKRDGLDLWTRTYGPGQGLMNQDLGPGQRGQEPLCVLMGVGGPSQARAGWGSRGVRPAYQPSPVAQELAAGGPLQMEPGGDQG